MAVIEIFSSPITYKYKSRICSLSTVLALVLILLSFFTPLFIIYHAGGFWMRNRMHVETPDILFGYKYLLIAERNLNDQPIVCSTFTSYKENQISDDCIIIKVQELDINKDGKKDILKFEGQFYTDIPIKSVKLLLFFNFRLRLLFEATIESIAVFDYTLNHAVQNINFISDLELQQRSLLRSEGLYEMYNHSIEVADFTLSELIRYNANKKFSAKISNADVIWQTGFSSEEVVTIKGELFYKEHLIYYQLSMWEELKWAWIQYVSFLLVFAYLTKHTLLFLFTNRYLNTYIVIPWKIK